MYLNEAIIKINNIKWNEAGTNPLKIQADYACEFLRRLAKFFKEESIKPTTPLGANIAQLLGDNEEEIIISDYCNSETANFLGEGLYVKKIIQYYIKLAKYVDKNLNAAKYLSVYEPLIKVLEKGGMYVLRFNSLEIENVILIPLNGWYEDFVNKEPFRID